MVAASSVRALARRPDSCGTARPAPVQRRGTKSRAQAQDWEDRRWCRAGHSQPGSCAVVCLPASISREQRVDVCNQRLGCSTRAPEVVTFDGNDDRLGQPPHDDHSPGIRLRVRALIAQNASLLPLKCVGELRSQHLPCWFVPLSNPRVAGVLRPTGAAGTRPVSVPRRSWCPTASDHAALLAHLVGSVRILPGMLL